MSMCPHTFGLQFMDIPFGGASSTLGHDRGLSCYSQQEGQHNLDIQLEVGSASRLSTTTVHDRGLTLPGRPIHDRGLASPTSIHGKTLILNSELLPLPTCSSDGEKPNL